MREGQQLVLSLIVGLGREKSGRTYEEMADLVDDPGIHEKWKEMDAKERRLNHLLNFVQSLPKHTAHQKYEETRDRDKKGLPRRMTWGGRRLALVKKIKAKIEALRPDTVDYCIASEIAGLKPSTPEQMRKAMRLAAGYLTGG